MDCSTCWKCCPHVRVPGSVAVFWQTCMTMSFILDPVEGNAYRMSTLYHQMGTRLSKQSETHKQTAMTARTVPLPHRHQRSQSILQICCQHERSHSHTRGRPLPLIHPDHRVVRCVAAQASGIQLVLVHSTRHTKNARPPMFAWARNVVGWILIADAAQGGLCSRPPGRHGPLRPRFHARY